MAENKFKFEVGGGKKSQKTKKVADVTTTAETFSKSTAKTDGTQRDTKVLQQLGAEERNQLSALMKQFGGDLSGGGASQIDFAGILGKTGTGLIDRAAGAGDFVQGQSDAVLAEARRQGEISLGQQTTNLAQATGSSQNSLVAALATQGRNDLETQLAALDAELSLRGRELGTKETLAGTDALSRGVQASGQQAETFSQIVQLLKGSDTRSVGDVTSSQISVKDEEINSLLEEIDKTKINQKGDSFDARFGYDANFGSLFGSTKKKDSYFNNLDRTG